MVTAAIQGVGMDEAGGRGSGDGDGSGSERRDVSGSGGVGHKLAATREGKEEGGTKAAREGRRKATDTELAGLEAATAAVAIGE